MNKRMLTEILISSGAGLAVGYGVGSFVTARRMKKEFNAIIDEELAKMQADMEDIHARINKTGKYATPESAAETLIDNDTLIANLDENEIVVNTANRDAFGQYKVESDLEEGEEPVSISMEDLKKFFHDAGDTPTRPEKSRESFVEQPLNPPVVEHNVFEDHEDEDEGELQDLDENEVINPEQPYVITIEQFHNTRDDHHKAVVIYYEGDDTLTDETDTIIDDIDGNVGRANLERFGHGSKAPNTVYIRNEKNGVDYEMVRLKRGWAEEKLAQFGVNNSEEKPRVRRMRGDE